MSKIEDLEHSTFQLEDPSINTRSNPEESQISTPFPAQTKTKKSRKKLTIPKYLVNLLIFYKYNQLIQVRFSSTYFKKSLNESFNNIRKTINHFHKKKPQKQHTRSISMNWVIPNTQNNYGKKDDIPNPDILFTLPSEKEKETARFDIVLPKENEDKPKHSRIYSMYNFKNGIEGGGSQRSVSNQEGIKHDISTANCLICFDRLPDSVFMECGHGGI